MRLKHRIERKRVVKNAFKTNEVDKGGWHVGPGDGHPAQNPPVMVWYDFKSRGIRAAEVSFHKILVIFRKKKGEGNVKGKKRPSITSKLTLIRHGVTANESRIHAKCIDGNVIKIRALLSVRVLVFAIKVLPDLMLDEKKKIQDTRCKEIS